MRSQKWSEEVRSESEKSEVKRKCQKKFKIHWYRELSKRFSSFDSSVALIWVESEHVWAELSMSWAHLTFFNCGLSCFSISESHADSTSSEFFDSWSYDLDVDDESTRLVLSRHLQAGRINSTFSHNHDIKQSHSQSFSEHIVLSMNHVIKVRTRDHLSVCRFQCVCSLSLSKQAARRAALLLWHFFNRLLIFIFLESIRRSLAFASI